MKTTLQVLAMVMAILSFNYAEAQKANYTTTESTGEVRASISNVKARENIILNINNVNSGNFSFNQSTQELIARFTLREGQNVIRITAQNEAGEDVISRLIIKESKPCPIPEISLPGVDQYPVTTEIQNFVFRAVLKNISIRSQLKLTVNGIQVPFNFSGRAINYTASLKSGINTFVLTAKNDCGEESKIARINYIPASVSVPCQPPKVDFILTAVDRTDATHELKGTVLNVKNKSNISLTVNGNPVQGFQFVPGTGVISAKFKFSPGTSEVVAVVKNICGQDSKTEVVTLEEEACGLRINPGNAAWEFCLVTAKGNYNKENLNDKSFSYTGPATSLFFKPIGGGGDAIVNEKSYSLRPGQYYLFSGKLTVTVSLKNPGSMGQWSVCIKADKEPVTGNGNKRPKSPCEVEEDNDKPDKSGKKA